jgi:hypothetical protein
LPTDKQFVTYLNREIEKYTILKDRSAELQKKQPSNSAAYAQAVRSFEYVITALEDARDYVQGVKHEE